jgi:hypothetical protein
VGKAIASELMIHTSVGHEKKDGEWDVPVGQDTIAVLNVDYLFPRALQVTVLHGYYHS